MDYSILQFLFFAEIIIFLIVVFSQMVKKNKNLVLFYLLQSTVVFLMLILISYSESSITLLVTAIIMFLVKVIIAPRFFLKLINNNQVKSSASSYLSTPVTLFVVMFIVIFANSSVFEVLISLSEKVDKTIPFAIASILSSIFLIINRRGALSQIIGILYLENSIISFAFLIEIKQTLVLELGILFDISVWIVIAVVFISMVYKNFGSLNISEIKKLQD
ncbi:hypothetical protein K0B03_01220 [Patescibacteria group bacterium]|nr:hypothetical protein [Patescibacteria group bacterium]